MSIVVNHEVEPPLVKGCLRTDPLSNLFGKKGKVASGPTSSHSHSSSTATRQRPFALHSSPIQLYKLHRHHVDRSQGKRFLSYII